MESPSVNHRDFVKGIKFILRAEAPARDDGWRRTEKTAKPGDAIDIFITPLQPLHRSLQACAVT
jgi:hypothetical protein